MQNITISGNVPSPKIQIKESFFLKIPLYFSEDTISGKISMAIIDEPALCLMSFQLTASS